MHRRGEGRSNPVRQRRPDSRLRGRGQGRAPDPAHRDGALNLWDRCGRVAVRGRHRHRGPHQDHYHQPDAGPRDLSDRPASLDHHAGMAQRRQRAGCADACDRGIRVPCAQPADRQACAACRRASHPQPAAHSASAEGNQPAPGHGPGVAGGGHGVHQCDPGRNARDEPPGRRAVGRPARDGEWRAAAPRHQVQRRGLAAAVRSAGRGRRDQHRGRGRPRRWP